MSDAQSQAGSLRAQAEASAAALPPLLARSEQLAQSVLLGAHGRRRSGVGDDFWQYRPARPGDSKRLIDHRRSAMGDGQFVREREAQIAQTVLLWVDPSASMNYRSSDKLNSKSEQAQLLALSTAILLQRAGERVGLIGHQVPPRRAQGHIMRIAQALVQAGGQERAMEYLPPEHRGLTPQTKALYFSDFLGPLDGLELMLSKAADRGVRGVVMQILDPAETQFQFAGRTIFESVLGKVTHETLKASELKTRYEAALATRKDELASLCRSAGWHYGIHHTDHPLQSALSWLWGVLDAGQGQ